MTSVIMAVFFWVKWTRTLGRWLVVTTMGDQSTSIPEKWQEVKNGPYLLPWPSFRFFFFIPPHVLSYMLYIIIKRKKSHENEGKKTGWKEQGKERWVLGIATGTKEGWSFNYVTDTSLSTTSSKGSGEMREFCFFPKSKLIDYVHLSIENATQYWAIAWNVSCFKSMKILQPV